MKAIESTLVLAFKALCVVIMVAAPLLGVWLATSLASFHGSGRSLALAAGVMLFPILPALWELYATRRWLRRPKRTERILTTLDRLILRTLAINIAFVGTLLVSYPKVAFAALATKGDWFIAHRSGPWAAKVRGALVRAASGLEWLHELANPNPYKKEGDEEPTPTTSGSALPVPVPTPVPAPSASASSPVEPPPAPSTVPSSAQGQPEPVPIEEAARKTPPDCRRAVGGTFWPYPNTVHPVVGKLSAEDERSPQTLADAIRTRVTDPFDRVKALHDWLVTRLRYDHESVTGKRRPQTASSVFESRLGVCEGYARLLKELGRLTGDRIAYVVGEVREENGGVMPVGHAWNAVEIQGSWYIVDATWDDPSNASGGDEDNYETTYLFIPPELAGLDHFPDERRWQLRPEPLARAEFLRQPLARPNLAREGLVLVRPERPSVDVTDTLEITMENPLRRFVMLRMADETCGVDDSPHLTLVCNSLRFQGRTTAHLFTNTEREGRYGSVASIEVTRQ